MVLGVDFFAPVYAGDPGVRTQGLLQGLQGKVLQQVHAAVLSPHLHSFGGRGRSTVEDGRKGRAVPRLPGKHARPASDSKWPPQGSIIL